MALMRACLRACLRMRCLEHSLICGLLYKAADLFRAELRNNDLVFIEVPRSSGMVHVTCQSQHIWSFEASISDHACETKPKTVPSSRPGIAGMQKDTPHIKACSYRFVHHIGMP